MRVSLLLLFRDERQASGLTTDVILRVGLSSLPRRDIFYIPLTAPIPPRSILRMISAREPKPSIQRDGMVGRNALRVRAIHPPLVAGGDVCMFHLEILGKLSFSFFQLPNLENIQSSSASSPQFGQSRLTNFLRFPLKNKL